MVPSGFGVWIPGGIADSNRVTANGKIGYLLVEPGAAALPHMNAGRGQAQFLPGRLTASHRLIVIAAVYA